MEQFNMKLLKEETLLVKKDDALMKTLKSKFSRHDRLVWQTFAGRFQKQHSANFWTAKTVRGLLIEWGFY